jgi:hypothetical protein
VNGSNSYQNGRSSYQNAPSTPSAVGGYQNGSSDYQNGSSSYQNATSSQDIISTYRNATSNQSASTSQNANSNQNVNSPYEDERFSYQDDPRADPFFSFGESPSNVAGPSNVTRSPTGLLRAISNYNSSERRPLELHDDMEEDEYWEEEDEEDETRFINFSLLSHVAVQFRDKVPRGTHVKGSIPYPRAFTGKDVVVRDTLVVVWYPD